MGVDFLHSSDFYSFLGEKIRMARKGKKIDQEALGQRIGLNRTSVINIEKGRQKPSMYHVWMMARILEIPLSELLPPYDLLSLIGEWEVKIKNNDQISTEVEKLKALEFVTVARIGR